jgi:hypothetical protein
MLNRKRRPFPVCLECPVLSLLAILFVIAIVLTVAMWFGTLFAQQYLYTEPAGGLYWRAPAAAAVLTGFLLFWSVVNVMLGKSATDKKVPFPYFIYFTTTVDLVPEPVNEFQSKRKAHEVETFRRDKLKAQTYLRVKNREEDRVGEWSSDGVEWIKLKAPGGEDMTFVRDKDAKIGSYEVFVDREHGWTIKESRMGIPSYNSFFRLVGYFLLNGLHLLLWIACFWLLLRYSIPHSILLGIIFWAAFTLLVFAGLSDAAQAAV